MAVVLTILNTRYTPGGRPNHDRQGHLRALTAHTEGSVAALKLALPELRQEGVERG
jgi:hypothetical protein